MGVGGVLPLALVTSLYAVLLLLLLPLLQV